MTMSKSSLSSCFSSYCLVEKTDNKFLFVIILFFVLLFNCKRWQQANSSYLLMLQVTLPYCNKHGRYFNDFKKVWWFFSFEGLLVFLKNNLEFCLRIAPWKKCAQKTWKVPNTIEEQAIVIYATLPSQGMSKGAF
jgi:hypothetical protein